MKTKVRIFDIYPRWSLDMEKSINILLDNNKITLIDIKYIKSDIAMVIYQEENDD